MAKSTTGRKGICTNPDCSEFKKPTTVDYGDFVCPKCGSELSEVKEGPQSKMWIYGIIGAVVLGGSAAWYLLAQGADTPSEPQSNGPDSVEVVTTPPTTVDPVTTNPGTETTTTTDPVTTNPGTETTTTTDPSPVKTAYGTYVGPMKGGKPNGIGGTVTVTVSKTVSLNDGRELSLERGDKLENTKFIDGRLVQANYVSKNGDEEFVNFGIANN